MIRCSACGGPLNPTQPDEHTSGLCSLCLNGPLPGTPVEVVLSLGFLAAAPTEAHAATHERAAREHGATDQQIAWARRLAARQQAADVQVIRTHPTQEDALP